MWTFLKYVHRKHLVLMTVTLRFHNMLIENPNPLPPPTFISFFFDKGCFFSMFLSLFQVRLRVSLPRRVKNGIRIGLRRDRYTSPPPPLVLNLEIRRIKTTPLLFLKTGGVGLWVLYKPNFWSSFSSKFLLDHKKNFFSDLDEIYFNAFLRLGISLLIDPQRYTRPWRVKSHSRC